MTIGEFLTSLIGIPTPLLILFIVIFIGGVVVYYLFTEFLDKYIKKNTTWTHWILYYSLLFIGGSVMVWIVRKIFIFVVVIYLSLFS